MQTVGIIGGGGFIGSYVVRKFLEENYQVRVSATDIGNKEKYQHLFELKNAERLEIEPLDVRDVEGLKAFVTDCDILVHSGTPFQLDVQDPQKELFEPTIRGTENFLQAVLASPSVKKVVFIASVAAYNTSFPLPAEGRDAGHVYSEADTPFIHESSHPYGQAKYYADQAVRKFVLDHPKLPFEIVSVFPVFVTGRQLSNRQDSTSMGMQFLFKNHIAPNPFVEMFYRENVEFAVVDVEDVADCVYKAATANGLHGKNYLLSGESWRVSDIALMLNKKAPEGASRIVYSANQATHYLGVHFKPAETSLGNYE